MQKCLRCGAPCSAPTCWRCGHEAAIDDRQSAAEGPTRAPDAAVPKPLPIEGPAAIARHSIPLRLLIGASAAGFVITLSIAIAAGRLSRPAAVQSVSAEQTTPARSPHSDGPVTVEPAPRPTWVGRRQAVWAYDGTKTVTFELDAIKDVPVLMSRARPQLVARCVSGTIDMYVVTGPLSFEHQTESHTVRVQVDDEPEQSQQWLDSESSHELFAPDGVALSDRLARAHRLRFGFTPFNAKPVMAEFIVDGFDQLASLLARTCGRRPSLPVSAKKRF